MNIKRGGLRMALGFGLGSALFVIEWMLLERLLALRREGYSSQFHGLCPLIRDGSKVFHAMTQFNAIIWNAEFTEDAYK